MNTNNQTPAELKQRFEEIIKDYGMSGSYELYEGLQAAYNLDRETLGQEPLSKEFLIDYGFVSAPHLTVMDSVMVDLGRGRYLSIGCIGTPNEILFIGSLNTDGQPDLVCMHNYDYDGKLTVGKLNSIYTAITGKTLKPIKYPQTPVEPSVGQTTEELAKKYEPVWDKMCQCATLGEFAVWMDKWAVSQSTREREMDRWVPVSERLPESEGYYTTWINGFSRPYELYFSKYDYSFATTDRKKIDITHWQPLPSAPGEQTTSLNGTDN